MQNDHIAVTLHGRRHVVVNCLLLRNVAVNGSPPHLNPVIRFPNKPWRRSTRGNKGYVSYVALQGYRKSLCSVLHHVKLSPGFEYHRRGSTDALLANRDKVH